MQVQLGRMNSEKDACINELERMKEKYANQQVRTNKNYFYQIELRSEPGLSLRLRITFLIRLII